MVLGLVVGPACYRHRIVRRSNLKVYLHRFLKFSVKQLIASFFIAAIVLGGFNLLVKRAARNSVPRQLIRRIDNMPHATHLALGNSLMAAGFDPASFDETFDCPVRSVNAGLGSTSPTEHLLILRHALRECPRLKFVVYGFFDFQLTDDAPVRVADLIGNRALSYYLEPDVALTLYSMTWQDRIAFTLYRSLPMMNDRSALWEKVEIVRRSLGRVGLPPVAMNRFGRAADFTLLESKSPDEFGDHCNRVASANIGLSAPIREILQESQAHHLQTIVVEMPMNPIHQARFYSLAAWRRYRTYLRALLERRGVLYITASDWINDQHEFADHIHLNDSGAVDFSRRLAETLFTSFSSKRVESEAATSRELKDSDLRAESRPAR